MYFPDEYEQYRAGTHRPDAGNLLKIRQVLGCKMADFFVDMDGAKDDDLIDERDIEKVIELLKLVKELR